MPGQPHQERSSPQEIFLFHLWQGISCEVYYIYIFFFSGELWLKNHLLYFRRPLLRHQETHKNDNISLECEKCNKVFPTWRKKSQHMRHHVPMRHRCKYCQERFAKRWEFFGCVGKSNKVNHHVSIPGYSFWNIMTLIMQKVTPSKQDPKKQLRQVFQIMN